jgi:hypothetical protein
MRAGMRGFEMRGEQVQHFALGLAGAVFLDKDLFRDLRVKPLLFGQIRQQEVVDLDPAIEFERLQPDGEES